MTNARSARRLAGWFIPLALVVAIGCGSSEAAPDASGGDGVGSGAAASAAAEPAGAPRLPVAETWCGAAPCPCQEGTQRTFGGGQVDKCTLAAAATVQGIPCAADKPLDFHDNGNLELCYLATATTLGPLPCAADDLVTFRETGLLKSCKVTAPVEISGMSCQGLVSIHPDGSIKYCNTAREQQVGSYTIPAGQGFEMHPDGHLHRWELYQHNVTAGGLVCKGTMMFYPDGRVAECRRLAEPFTTGGATLAADERACFDPQGAVIDCSTSHQYLVAFPE